MTKNVLSKGPLNTLLRTALERQIRRIDFRR